MVIIDRNNFLFVVINTERASVASGAVSRPSDARPPEAASGLQSDRGSLRPRVGPGLIEEMSPVETETAKGEGAAWPSIRPSVCQAAMTRPPLGGSILMRAVWASELIVSMSSSAGS